jgi:hypothetical protein
MPDIRYTDEQLNARLDYAKSMVPVHSTWVHKKNLTEYMVVMVSLREVDCEPLVSYARLGDKFSKSIPWTRTIDEFKASFDLVEL